MASEKEIQLVCEIQRIAIQVNMQGKYNTWAEYHGHVNSFDVRASLPWHADVEPLEGWGCHEKNVYLSTGYELGYDEEMADVIEDKVEQLEKLKASVLSLLDVDADGVPV